jgi:tRNA(adenine34) deaminase
MEAALEEARIAARLGEVPVGAAIAHDHAIVATAHNETVRQCDLTQHAEMLAIRRALCEMASDRLDGATLYVTLEPCAQCAGAIILTRVRRVLFGAYDPKAGMAGSVEDLLRHSKLNHRPEVMGGVLEEECGALLTDFFERMRGETGNPTSGPNIEQRTANSEQRTSNIEHPTSNIERGAGS